ncbi:MAG: serine/threonine-protein phosphatase [Propionibacteriales bacterium]|nr:serine/threonine-protein phosphatase [Propionibacteriales bacterium]
MTLGLHYSAVSDVGRVRSNNQDSGYAGRHFLIVADGVGGAASGDLASAVTVQTMRRLDNEPAGNMLEALVGAFHRANVRLGEIIDDDPRVEGMGTTVTAMLFDGEQVGLAHLGDSRAYLLRDGELSQLTHDHTFVQTLVDDGRISAEEARTHPHRNLIMKVLDGRQDNEPDLSMHTVTAGDRLLLCSDGLPGFVDDDAIKQILADGSPDSVSIALVQAALDANSSDNITVVVADLVGAGDPVDPESAASLGPLLVGAAAEQQRGRLDDTTSQPRVRGDRSDGGPVDHEHLRYAPRPPQRFRWFRRIFLLCVLVALVVAAGMFVYDWSQDQYFVTDDGDTVAIYHGIDADLPGLTLFGVEESTQVRLEQLTPYWRDQVTSGIDVGDLADARRMVSDLEAIADQCEALQTPPPKPKPTASRTPTRRPTATATPTRTPTPTSTPTTGAPSDAPDEAVDCEEGAP